MQKKTMHQADTAELRGRANKRMKEKNKDNPCAGEQIYQEPEGMQRLIDELQVHQVELEMQNEELVRIKEDLETAWIRYFDLFELAPIGYLIVDEAGLILESNLTAANLLMLDRSAIVQQPLASFILPEDLEIYSQNCGQIFEAGALRYCELRLLRRDETSFWARLGGTVIKDDGGASVCRVVLSDVSERKQAEEALKASEKKFRSIMENAGDAIILADRQGMIIAANGKAEALLGYKRDELLRLHYSQAHPLSEQQKLTSVFEDMFEQKVDRVSGILIQRKDGNIAQVDVTSSVIDYAGEKVILGVFRDISEQVQATRILEELVQKRTAELSQNVRQLKLEIIERKNTESLLEKQKNELFEQANKLTELNVALKVLLQQRESDKSDLEEKMTLNVKGLIIPCLEALTNRHLDAQCNEIIGVIENILNEIISPFASKLSSKYYSLTPREIEIANLVRLGKSTKDIVNTLGISSGSVIIHRNHIRRKLNIVSKKINLRSHLASLS